MEKDCLQKLLEEGCVDVSAFFSCGNQYGQVGDFANAVKAFNKAAELNSKYAEIFYNRAGAKNNLGDLLGAIEDYNEVVRINPDNENAFYNRGRVKKVMGDLKGAKDDFEKVISINSNAALAFDNLGITKSLLGDLKGAISDFDQAIKINPEAAHSYYNRGQNKRKLGERIEALSNFEQAIKLDPNFDLAILQRGVVKYDLGDWNGALNDFNQVIELNPESDLAYFNRGLLKTTIGVSYSAEQDLLKGLYLSNDQEDYFYNTLVKLFSYDYPAPILIYYLLEEHPLIRSQISFQILITENARHCRPSLTWLRYLDCAKYTPEPDAQWLSALIHLGMGDPIRAYAMLDSLGDELPVQYFLMVAAEDILHEERSSIREFAVKAASASVGAHAREWYYAGRILQIAGDIPAALNCYDKSESYWPSAFAKAGITGVRPETREDFSNGLPVTVLEPDGRQWLNAVERAVLFYDLEEEISLFAGRGKPFPRFWEVWDVSQLIEPLRQLEMDLRENWLKQVFQKHFEAAYQERKPESKRFEHHEEVQDKFRQLKKSKTLTHDLSLLIHGNQWAPEECAALVEYFYLAGKLHIDDVFYLYFYLLQNSHRASTAANEGVDEWLKTFAEKLLSPLFQVLGIFGEAIAAGIGEALKVLFQKFIETKHSRIPPTGDGMTDFERFQSSFKQHILDTFEDLGEEAFFKLYPIQGFDRY